MPTPQVSHLSANLHPPPEQSMALDTIPTGITFKILSQPGLFSLCLWESLFHYSNGHFNDQNSTLDNHLLSKSTLPPAFHTSENDAYSSANSECPLVLNHLTRYHTSQNQARPLASLLHTADGLTIQEKAVTFCLSSAQNAPTIPSHPG